MIKKKLLGIVLVSISFFAFTIAQGNQNPDFEIIPGTGNVGNTVDGIRKGGSVWDLYKDAAYGKKKEGGKGERVGTSLTLGEQFASGVMSWDTILDYAVYLVKFLGQLALLAGAIMIIYLGYKKATEHFKAGSSNLSKVIIGILVISFAYVIVKIIWNMFIS